MYWIALEVIAAAIVALGIHGFAVHFFSTKKIADLVHKEIEKLTSGVHSEVVSLVGNFDRAHAEIEKLTSGVHSEVVSLVGNFDRAHADMDRLIQSHVITEVANKIRMADIAVCSFCKRQVARFEKLVDGRTLCANCNHQGMRPKGI